MAKFVVFNYGEGYQKCILTAYKSSPNVRIFHPFKNTIVKKIFKWHNAWSVNKYQELPFKKIWFERCLSKMELQNEEQIYFLFYESFHLAYSKKFLRYLKRRYKKSKFCFIFSNPVSEYNLEKVKAMDNYYNAIITFFKKDAEQYNFLFCEYQPFQVPKIEKKAYPYSDVFFIGSNKGRLSDILKIYKQLTDAGLICDFYIVGVPLEEQKYQDEIIYNKKLTYDEVLNKVYSTSCILEILQGNASYMSIRTVEAMQYHKKLLTTSMACRNQKFYNSQIIQIISNEDIDVNFVKNIVNDSVYPDRELWSFSSFEKFIIENIGGEIT